MFKRLMLLLLLALTITACAPTESAAPTTASTNTPRASIATPTREGLINTPDSVNDNDTGEVQGDPGSGFGFETTFEGGFQGIIAGARSAVMDGSGYFACENNRYVIRPANSGLQQITIILNPSITPGTHQLGNQGAADAAAMVAFNDGGVYAGNVQGVLVLNNMAVAPDQQVRGSFDFSASNGTDTINAAGEFNFLSSSGVQYCS